MGSADGEERIEEKRIYIVIMSEYIIPTLPLPYDLETKEILKQVNRANRKLAELKGVALTIPTSKS